MEELVYFEVNNWIPGRYYPDNFTFDKWVGNEDTDDDEDDSLWRRNTFFDDEFLKKNELVISFGFIDQSFDFCVVAKKSWVEQNCPSLLNEDSKFLAMMRDGKLESNFGIPYLEYTAENFGFHYFHKEKDPDDHLYWEEQKEI